MGKSLDFLNDTLKKHFAYLSITKINFDHGLHSIELATHGNQGFPGSNQDF